MTNLNTSYLYNMLDYIVVGLGLAGISFCEHLQKHNKTFIVYNDASQQASTVASGLYNPVVLKRFTPIYKAKEQLQIAIPFYKTLEKKLYTTFQYPIPIYRRFSSVSEQNLWFESSDKPHVQEFLSSTIIKNTNQHIKADLGYGKVLHTGKINTKKLVETYQKYLLKKEKLHNTTFLHHQLQIFDDYIQYDGVQAKHIVFAEGFGIKKNPFFNYLPLKEAKGELLTIKAPQLKLNFVLKASIFIIPLNDNFYQVGTTYDWNDKTQNTTPKAKEQLTSKLHKIITCPYKITNQVAGIRPTFIDRRPLVGNHPKHKNLYILNGLGTRGVLWSPYCSKQLFNYIENKQEVDPEINSKRFQEKFYLT